MMSFSVAMSVYKNDNPADFKTAIHSIYTNQTLKPSEIILVKDGPIPEELELAVQKVVSELSIIHLVVFEHNRGHAAARQAGLENATNDLVAIMDSDDIAEPDRFEKQLKYMIGHPEVTVSGSLIKEFIGEKENVVGMRIVPEHDEEIKDYLKSRCPMNLQTVMYRKSKVQEVGGFIDWYCEEDYYLWIRLALAGHFFYNEQECYVNVRVGKEMYQRRGGLKYFKSEEGIQRYMFQHHLISLPRYLYNVTGRFVIQVMMPNWLRGFVFRTLFRK